MYSKRVEQIKSLMVMQILARVLELEKQGNKVIHLELGEPEVDTPFKIISHWFSEIKKEEQDIILKRKSWL